MVSGIGGVRIRLLYVSGGFKVRFVWFLVSVCVVDCAGFGCSGVKVGWRWWVGGVWGRALCMVCRCVRVLGVR